MGRFFYAVRLGEIGGEADEANIYEVGVYHACRIAGGGMAGQTGGYLLQYGHGIY